MTNAYDEKYLFCGMENLGEALDYASNACHVDIESFMRLFISTGFAEMFGNGNPKVIAGLSGTELAIEVFSKAGIMDAFPEAQTDYECSPEYWCGYNLSYYQWQTAKSFKDILSRITMADILKLYPTLHEASEEKFVDTLNAIFLRKNVPSKLQLQRKLCGLTQKELSEKAGVNLRTLQQYETRAKDLNQAAASTVLTLSKVLGCDINDLVET